VTALLLAAGIVSTTPSITEILFAVGLGDKVVGVTTYCRHPAEARSRTKIGTFAQPDLERIVSLKPDLVVVEDNGLGLRAKVERLGLRVLEVRHGSVAEVLEAIDRIAVAGGRERGRLAATIRADLDSVRARVRGRPPTSMAFIVGRDPGTARGIIAAGPGSYLSEIMAVAGGRNVFDGAVAAYPKISAESLLGADPEVIVDMAEMASGEGLTAGQRESVVKLWGVYPTLRAVRMGRVHPVSNDAFVVAGPRMVDAAREFARMLHPELFR
jgi:iron complex transport system substrate-binding protein